METASRRWAARSGWRSSSLRSVSRIRAVTVLRARSASSPRRRVRPAEARRGAQLVEQRLAFGVQVGRPRGRRRGRRPGRSPRRAGRGGAGSAPWPRRRGPGRRPSGGRRPAGAGRRVEQLDRGHVAARAAQQRVQVVQALGVGQVHDRAVVRELPHRPVAPELVPPRSQRAIGAAGRARQPRPTRERPGDAARRPGRQVGVERPSRAASRWAPASCRAAVASWTAAARSAVDVAVLARVPRPAGRGQAGAGEQRPRPRAQPVGGVAAAAVKPATASSQRSWAASISAEPVGRPGR